MVFGWFEAGRGANSAVDVDGGVALAADEMVVIVPDPGLVERGASGGFKPADDPGRDERVEVVVNRLARQRPEPSPCRGHDVLRIPVLTFMLDCVQNGQPLRSHAKFRLLEQLLDLFSHGFTIPSYLDNVQITTDERDLSIPAIGMYNIVIRRDG